jgi:RimJ/RimL family protein N-acetyltransferase
MTTTDSVRLRPVEAADAPVLAAWDAAPASDDPWNDFGPPDPTLGEAGVPQRLLVEAGGEIVGSVSWHPVRYGPNAASLAFNMGISLVPAARGRGIGTLAHRLLVVYLFATTSVHRVEASTDVANIAEQRALEKAGFRREGVLRGAQYRAGAWRDLVGYSRLRTDE